MLRPYGNKKSARLPGARISEEFRDLLQKWAGLLQVSQAQLIENAVSHYISDENCFERCPACDKPAMTTFHIQLTKLDNVKCPSCGHVFDLDLVGAPDVPPRWGVKFMVPEIGEVIQPIAANDESSAITDARRVLAEWHGVHERELHFLGVASRPE